ncbi:MAG TPA: oligosaccharide flippase family protein [Polyangiaceae bacterium]|jgi:PST family polysaccharide transporter
MAASKETVVRGASWTIAAGLATRILGLISSVVVTHYVTPEALGNIGAAQIFILTANSITTAGIGPYLVATKHRERDETFHVTALTLFGSIGIVALVFLIRGPLGAYFNVADSAIYLPWLLGCFLLDRLAFVPERLLIRNFQFRRIALARSMGDVAYVIVTLGLAIYGWGGYSLIAGNIARSVARAWLMISGTKGADWLTPAPLRMEVFKRILRFGLPVAGQGFVAGVAARWDNMIFSRIWGGAAEMTHYNYAYQLADMPADQIGEQIGEALLPSFAQMPPEERDAFVVEATGITALLIFPISVGLGVVAPTVVATVFPPSYYETGGMLTILAALSVTRPLSYQMAAYLQAVGRPQLPMVVETLKMVLLMTLLLTLGRVSKLWFCGAVGLAFAAALFTHWWIVARRIQRHVWVFISECLPAAAACAVMAGAVVAVRWGLSHTSLHYEGSSKVLQGLFRVIALVIEIVVGALAYVGALPIVARQASGKLVALFRKAYQRRAAKRPATA